MTRTNTRNARNWSIGRLFHLQQACVRGLPLSGPARNFYSHAIPSPPEFSITPSNLLVRLAAAPLTVTFDSATRNVLRYEGRVPPMREEGGQLKALDARVDYAMKVPVYR